MNCKFEFVYTLTYDKFDEDGYFEERIKNTFDVEVYEERRKPMLSISLDGFQIDEFEMQQLGFKLSDAKENGLRKADLICKVDYELSQLMKWRLQDKRYSILESYLAPVKELEQIQEREHEL